MVGGSPRDSFPKRAGRVLAGCFIKTKRYNPAAPDVIHIGRTKSLGAGSALRRTDATPL